MRTLSKFHQWERRIDDGAERFLWHHRAVGSILLFVGAPLAVLACVCIGTFAIALPLALLFGWF